MDDVTKAFKGFKGLCLLMDLGQILTWQRDAATKLPTNKIQGISTTAHRVMREFTPYQIKRIECTKPGFFKKGSVSVIGQDDKSLVEMPHSEKANLKEAEKFNYYLELYRNYNLPE